MCPDTSEEEGESDFADDEMSCELCENHETCTYTDAEIVEVQTEMIQQMAAKQEVSPQGKNDKEIDLDENLVAGGHDNGAAAATTSGGPLFHCLEEHLTNLVPSHVAREVGSQETATTCSPHCDLKHVDELPREIRYEVLETGVAEDERDDDDNTDPQYKQEEHLDELLHEVYIGFKHPYPSLPFSSAPYAVLQCPKACRLQNNVFISHPEIFPQRS